MGLNHSPQKLQPAIVPLTLGFSISPLFEGSRLVCLPLVASLMLFGSGFAQAQTPASSIAFRSYRNVLNSAMEVYSTAYYGVSSFSWLSASLAPETYPPYYYPDTTRWHPGGYFSLYLDATIAGDFNNDGREDLALQWVVFPHTLERNTLLSIDILINQGDNTFARSEAFSGSPLQIHMPYRIKKGHFNDDETQDVVSGSMGIITRLADGSYYNKNEPFAVLMSQSDGSFLNAHSRVGEQTETEPHPGYSFSHDLSVGDINGDGYDDIYLGKMLFINDANGGFNDASSQLPPEISAGASHYTMSSASDDFNKDGFDDIAILFSEGADPPGYIWLSDGLSSHLPRGALVPLPVGLYGPNNTKFNDTAAADFDGDGDTDLVMAVTRANPYYEGSKIQLLENDGAGHFRDVTGDLISYDPSVDAIHGEGVLFPIDSNEDGRIDIHHALSGPEGYRLYLNTDHGFVISSSDLPRIQPSDVASCGPGGCSPYSGYHTKAFPVDIDGIPPVDFVSTLRLDNEIVFYSVNASRPLRTTPPTGSLSFEATDTIRVVSSAGFLLRWSPSPFSDFTEIEQSSDPDYEDNYKVSTVLSDSLFIVPASGSSEVYVRLRSGNNIGYSEYVNRTFRVASTVDIESGNNEGLPAERESLRIYPSPFSGSTTVDFELSRTARVRIMATDLLGRQVATLVGGEIKSFGHHTVQFNADGLASGTYLIRMEAGDFVVTQQVVLLK
jgi:hypothetical protein